MRADIKKICKAQEQHLLSAVESNYKRATTSKEVDDMIKVHNSIFKKEWNDNRNCSICLLKLYKKVGEWYKVQVGLERRQELIDKQNIKNKE